MGLPTTATIDRAAHLRALARRLESAELHLVARAGSAGVWEGPAAADCATQLLLHARMLLVQAEHLRIAASRLEHS